MLRSCKHVSNLVPVVLKNDPWCSIFATTAYSEGVTGVFTWPTWHTKIR